MYIWMLKDECVVIQVEEGSKKTRERKGTAPATS